LAQQIKASREADERAEQRARKWQPLEACQMYDFDPVLDNATARIWATSKKGTDYTPASVDSRDVITTLNYLDGIATGVAQGLCIEAIVRDHLGPIFAHAQENVIQKNIVTKDGLESYIALYDKWFSVTPTPQYRR
jgi:hypothetical protein